MAEKQKQSLPVPLTPAEVAAKSRELARLVQDKNAKEEERTQAAQQFSADIKDMVKRQNELARQIDNGQEWRDIDVEEVKNYETKTVDIVRKDTNEIVSSRGMTPEERQETLQFPQGARKIKGGKDSA